MSLQFVMCVSSQPLLQVVRLNFQSRPASQVNQSAFVDKAKMTVTYYVTSPSNQTTAVLFDSKSVSAPGPSVAHRGMLSEGRGRLLSCHCGWLGMMLCGGPGSPLEA